MLCWNRIWNHVVVKWTSEPHGQAWAHCCYFHTALSIQLMLEFESFCWLMSGGKTWRKRKFQSLEEGIFWQSIKYKTDDEKEKQGHWEDLVCSLSVQSNIYTVEVMIEEIAGRHCCYELVAVASLWLSLYQLAILFSFFLDKVQDVCECSSSTFPDM